MVKDLKEVSDGDIKVAVSTIYINLEVRKNQTGGFYQKLPEVILIFFIVIRIFKTVDGFLDCTKP